MTARPVSMDRLFEKNSLSHHRRTFRRLLRVTFILLLLIVVLSPFYVAVLYAFKPATEITANRLAFSKNPTLENFHNVIFENELFGIGFKNSVINTIPTVLILMGFTSMAAWVLARYDSRVYRLIYAVLTLGLLIPFQCFELPLFLNWYNMGLVSTNIGFIIARSGLQISISMVAVTGFVKPSPASWNKPQALTAAIGSRPFGRSSFR